MIQLSKAPQVASKMLQKNLIKEQAPKDQHFQQANLSGAVMPQFAQTREIDILLKLLPYFEVKMNLKQADGPDARQLRKYLGIAKSEADMIERQKGVTTLVQLIGIYFDRLVSPGFAEQVIADLRLCFYNSEARAREFVSVLTRIVWEYNFVNKMFVTNYKLLSSKVDQG